MHSSITTIRGQGRECETSPVRSEYVRSEYVQPCSDDLACALVSKVVVRKQIHQTNLNQTPLGPMASHVLVSKSGGQSKEKHGMCTSSLTTATAVLHYVYTTTMDWRTRLTFTQTYHHTLYQYQNTASVLRLSSGPSMNSNRSASVSHWESKG